MRYQRLILEAGSNAVTVRFHPRLTVVAGVGRRERDLLVTELLGAMSGSRPGAHLELVDDSGRRLALIRPDHGPHRVLEVDSGDDVTDEFTSPAGRPDLLAAMGLTTKEARRRCRLSGAELVVESQADSLVSALASADQRQLWPAADRLVAAERALMVESQEAGADVEDAPLIEDIERRHAEFETAQQQNEYVRHHGVFIAGACLPAAGIARFLLHNTPATVGFAAVAALTLLVAVVFRRRMARARVAEDEALARAGKQSYIGFQIQRVDRLLDGQKSLSRVAMASEEQRLALAEWQQIAGDVSPDWALENRQQIEAQSQRREGGDPSGGVHPDLDPAELAHWLAARFTALRRVGPAGESLPLVLDDPLVGVDAGVKQWILELIGRSAGSPQVVYLTADPDVAAWARLEAMAGHLSVLEPAPEEEAAGGPTIAELSATTRSA